ncbi:hypothetical protein GOODEAATRI_000049 [Goodea atripinnis]|uniref:Uncharacterized protein n=1 Tax=Goodea atripinnis TaxID=208336 RepID=A0ABV0NQX7_9TELE
MLGGKKIVFQTSLKFSTMSFQMPCDYLHRAATLLNAEQGPISNQLSERGAEQPVQLYKMDFVWQNLADKNAMTVYCAIRAAEICSVWEERDICDSMMDNA